MDYKTIIEAPYNRQNWQYLLHDIFQGNITFYAAPAKINTDTTVADCALYLGKVNTTDDRTIAVYEVPLAQNIVVERNKVKIRNLLLQHQTNNGFDGAFMLCYKSNENQLRFSFVSRILQFEQGKLTTKQTATKRYTYLLGEGHHSRTAIEQFTKLKNSALTLDDITSAFSVEALNDEFFKQYKEQYEKFCLYIYNNKNDKTKFGDKFIEIDNKVVRDYVKKLLGRIVFLHFLQRKGWLCNDFNFMLNTFRNSKYQGDFLDCVLEPLFFAFLNTKPSDRRAEFDKHNRQKDKKHWDTAYIKMWNDIPYLNGGLFEADAEDPPTSVFPAEYFAELLEFFGEYNFTIDENDPNDAEVGVDPEMLGRIFENLLEDNKDKGAFYTPKEIVRYMCREALIAYLNLKVPNQDEQNRHFVENDDAQNLPCKSQIKNALHNVKICDPAIGSGAFPIGMLNELLACHQALDGEHTNSTEIKKHIIQNNIYGVDVEKGAIDIARLRFWLSIVVDSDNPEPLPNFDYKFMQGNSLLEQYAGADLSTMTDKKASNDGTLTVFDDMLDVYRKQLRDKLSQYYACTEHDKKNVLRADITELVQRQLSAQGINIDLSNIDLAANNQFFLWHTWFHDVFATGGFDIVIGNPPYGAKVGEQEKKIFKEKYVTAKTIKNVQKGSVDTYTLFIELGYNLLKNNSVMSFIVPMSFTSSDALTGVHKLLMDNCKTIRVSSYAVRPEPVFKNAVIDTSIILLSKTNTACQKLYSTRLNRKKGTEFSLQNLIDHLEFAEVKSLKLFGRIPKISLQIEKEILQKIFKQNKIANFIDDEGKPIYYRAAGGRYFKVITNYSTNSSAEKHILFEKRFANSIACILSSNLSFWFYQIFSDNHNWKCYELESFTIPNLNNEQIALLENLYQEYLTDIEKNANVRVSSGNSTYKVSQFKEYKIVKSKKIIDKIDDIICPLYGLTQEETDFIKNYELYFRMSGNE